MRTEEISRRQRQNSCCELRTHYEVLFILPHPSRHWYAKYQDNETAGVWLLAGRTVGHTKEHRNRTCSLRYAPARRSSWLRIIAVQTLDLQFSNRILKKQNIVPAAIAGGVCKDPKEPYHEQWAQ